MSNARNIELSTNTLDQVNTFGLLVNGQVLKCSVPDYYGLSEKPNFAPFIMQVAGMLKSEYTEADREESARIASEEPIKCGDVVSIKGKKYRVKVLGNYSDPATLTAI